MPAGLKIIFSILLSLATGGGVLWLLPAINLDINFWPQVILFCMVLVIAVPCYYSMMPPAMKED